MLSNYIFDRPVFILAAPRSGSTLLFETLMQCSSLWSIGDESHALIESNPRLRPGFGYCDSNRLTEKNIDEDSCQSLRSTFLKVLRNREGQLWQQGVYTATKPRMLEKTPKNSLRVPLLNAIFPDALFIYLYRDPRENMSSMIEAWRSGRFITYPHLAGENFPWSLLLPPGWQHFVERPLEEIAAFQWNAANNYILDDLNTMDDRRWTALSYAQLVEDPVAAVRKLCIFMEVSVDEHLTSVCANGLPLSKYTITPPSQDKWKKNAGAVQKVLPVIEKTIEKIQVSVAKYTTASVLLDRNTQ